jgi:curved DNA-binding protein CbpA
MKPSEIKNYYERLGVLKSSSKDEIKSAYRKLAKQYHPDRNPGKEKESQIEFIAISEAFVDLIKRVNNPRTKKINFGDYFDIEYDKYNQKDLKFDSEEIYNFYKGILI